MIPDASTEKPSITLGNLLKIVLKSASVEAKQWQNAAKTVGRDKNNVMRGAARGSVDFCPGQV